MQYTLLINTFMTIYQSDFEATLKVQSYNAQSMHHNTVFFSSYWDLTFVLKCFP